MANLNVINQEKAHIKNIKKTLWMILVFFLSFHNRLLWLRVGSFSELSFNFFFFFFFDPTIQKSLFKCVSIS